MYPIICPSFTPSFIFVVNLDINIEDNDDLNWFPFCPQHTSLSPDGKLVVIVGDNPEGILVDSQTGKVVFSFGLCYKFRMHCVWVNYE